MATANSNTNLAASTRSLYRGGEQAAGPPPPRRYSTCRASAPGSGALKRNSVPCAGQRNYPTLQATALAQDRRGSAAAHIHYGLNIPAGTPDRPPSGLLDASPPPTGEARGLGDATMSDGTVVDS